MSSAIAIGAKPGAFAQRCDVRFPGTEPADQELPVGGSAREERGLEDLPSGGWTGLGQPSVLSLDDCGAGRLGLAASAVDRRRPGQCPLATVRLRRPARISSGTAPDSPSRRPPKPSHAIAFHLLFAKFSHFPGCSVERQPKRRPRRRASWDSDAFKRGPFLSASRLSQTQGGRWRPGGACSATPRPFRVRPARPRWRAPPNRQRFREPEDRGGTRPPGVPTPDRSSRGQGNFPVTPADLSNCPPSPLASGLRLPYTHRIVDTMSGSVGTRSVCDCAMRRFPTSVGQRFRSSRWF